MTTLAPHPVTGSPLRWARDMALVGGGTSAFVPALVSGLAPDGYPISAALAGVVTGALLGLAMPTLLDVVRGKVPLPMLLLCSVGLGAAWGGVAGALAGLPFGAGNAALGLVAGSIAGAAQFGWWWFPYTFQTVRRGRTWPLLVASLFTLPLVSALSVWGTMILVLGGGMAFSEFGLPR
jgi:hypothetical protein